MEVMSVISVTLYVAAFIGFVYAGLCLIGTAKYQKGADCYLKAITLYRQGRFEDGQAIQAEGKKLAAKADHYVRWIPFLG
jgi:hypothetical protein